MRNKSPLEQVLHRFKKNRMAKICLVILVVLFLMSFLVPFFFADTSKPNEVNSFRGPTLFHPFGTDAIGVDLFTKVFEGLRITLTVGLIATVISLILGVIYGAISGYIGGYVDEAMMRFVDILYGLPVIAYVMLLIFVFRGYGEVLFGAQQGFFGRSNQYLWEVFIMTLAMGSISWLTIARIVRGEVLVLREQDYVEAARAIGAKPSRILFVHILPNLIGPVIVYATLTAPNVMLFESFISFLGLGVQPPHHSLGQIISDGLARIAATNIYWWLLFFPGAVLAAVLFCLNVLGDGLRDAFDVR